MGSVLISRNKDTIVALEDVTDVGVAGSYILLKFANGVTVLEREDGVERVQFTPAAKADDTEDVGEGTDNEGD